MMNTKLKTKTSKTISGLTGYKLWKMFVSECNLKSYLATRGHKQPNDDKVLLPYFNKWLLEKFNCSLSVRYAFTSGTKHLDTRSSIRPWWQITPDIDDLYELKFTDEKYLTWYLLNI